MQPGFQYVRDPKRGKQPGLNSAACPEKLKQPGLQCQQDLNKGKQPAVNPTAYPNHKRHVYKSSTAVQGDAAQPPPTFSFYRKRTTHPLSSAPHKKEALSLLPNSTSQQSRKDQSKRPVPFLEPQSEASEHSQTLHLCNKLPASAEEEIPSCFQTFTLVQLTGIVNGSQENWRYKVQSGQSSTEETIQEKGLKFNVPFGHFLERQTDFLLELIAKQYLQCAPN